MSELNDLMGETSPVVLSELVGTPLPTIQHPASAIRNRAATIALSADPEKALDNYQIMVAEAGEGKADYTNYLKEQVTGAATKQDEQAALRLLGDPSTPFEQKKAIMAQFRMRPELKDSSHTLYTNLASKPSYGETRDTDDARANSTERAMAGIYKAREDRQALVNAHAAGLRDVGAETFGEAATYWVLPLGMNIAQAREVRGSGAKIADTLKAFFLPGSSTKDQIAAIESVPVEERNAAIKNYLENIKDKGVILSDNHFMQMDKVNKVLGEGGYSNAERFLDDFAGVLDIVGAGGLLRGAGRAVRASKAASQANVNTFKAKLGEKPQVPVKEGAVTPPPAAPVAEPIPVKEFSFSLRPKTFDEVQSEVGANQRDLVAKLQEEKASLLGSAGNVLDKGQVSKIQAELKSLNTDAVDVKQLTKEIQKTEKLPYKEALKKAEKEANSINGSLKERVARLERTLESNRNASTVSQRIDAIDKEIADIEKTFVGMPSKKTAVADLVSRIQANAVVRTTNPLSPHAITKQANPEAAANSFATIFKSEDDNVAQAMAGTSRTDALADDVFPQAVTESGKVASQPADIQRVIRKEALPSEIHEFLGTMGRLDFTAAEKASVRAIIKNDFETAGGLSMHESMGGFRSSFTATGDKIEISAVYGKPDGPWSSARDAVDQAMLSLRKYGVLEEEITVLKNDGLDYVPVALSEVENVPGAYMIRINTEHTIDPTDVVKFEGVTTKLNFLDRMPASFMFQKGLASWIAPSDAMIDPKIYAAASAVQGYSAKLEKMLLKEASKFSDKWAALKGDSQKRVDAYILDANLNQVKFDPTDMSLRLGMSADEIDAVRDWRNYWDGHFFLENADLIRSYNEQGYELFRTATDEFHAKPYKSSNGKPPSAAYSINHVYDPQTQAPRFITRKEMEDLYTNGGNVARFRRPVQFGSDVLEHMIVRNTPNEYTRAFRDSDRALNYREGYFTVYYDRPRFVDEISKDANGNEIRRAVAVSRDTVEATKYADRANKNAPPGVRYVQRADDRAIRRGSDDWFDIASGSGRIAQRHRGKNLEDAAGVNHLGGMNMIESPVASAVKAARSIAGRTVSRPVVESAKARLMDQFGHLFKSDGMGGVKWPSSVGEIGEKGMYHSKEVADARSNWAYINYLENGIINGMDDLFKQFFGALSEKAGEIGLGKTQRALGAASEESLTGLGKGSVFALTIGSQFLRQIFVQSHQALRVLAYNPKYLQSDTWGKDVLDFVKYVSHGRPQAAYKSSEFIRYIENSGFMDSVDKHSLVRGTLMDAAEGRSRFRKYITAPGRITQQLGFNTGERANLLFTLGAVYEKFKRTGMDLADPDVRAKAYAEARAVAGEMTYAGDMPYSQNSAALFTQFLQVMHKLAAQPLNRNLDKQEKIRMVLFDTIMWGPPIYVVNAMAQEFFDEDILPENKIARELLTEGFEASVFNNTLRYLTGKDDIHIDWSSLAPNDYAGFAESIHALATGNIPQVFTNSPFGTLFGKEEGRVRNAYGSVMRFIGIHDPVGESPDDFVMVLREVAKTTSLGNDLLKARMMLNAQERLDNYGRSNGEVVHAVEALAQAFGFAGKGQKDLFDLSKAVNETKKKHEERVTKLAKDALRYAQNKMEEGSMSIDQISMATNFMLQSLKDDPEGLKIWNKQLAMALTDPDTRLMNLLLKSANFPGADKIIDEVKVMDGVSEEDKQKVIQLMEQTRKIGKE